VGWLLIKLMTSVWV